jgi:hypothetical protein
MADAVLALAYEHQLPLALECVTREAVQKRLELRLRGQSVRNVIAAISASAPGCRVDFSHGLVDVYSAEARADASDPFNTVVAEYRVVGVDTDTADRMLFCTLGRQLYPHSAGCGGNTAGDQWGNVKITLEMRNAKVYQILNAIVAQNRRAVWTPIRPPGTSPDRRRGYLTNFWSIYPLDPDFEQAVAAGLRSLLPPTARPDPHGGGSGRQGPPLGSTETRSTGGSTPRPCGTCGTTTASPPGNK